MPEVSPDTDEVAGLLQEQNTQACEQLNAWISRHTLSGLEMPPGKFYIYWWALFAEHNAWLEKQGSRERRQIPA
eukprot:12238549-Heterocapsa_arctica.AAC.1